MFELTDDYPLTIAVMISVVLASLLARQFVGGSFFNWQLERTGFDLQGGFEAALLRSLTVLDVVTKESETIDISSGIQVVRDRLQRSEFGELFVIRKNRELFGTITLADLSELAFDHDADNLVNAGDIARVHPPMLEASDDLYEANRIIRESGEHHIAVIESHDNMMFFGTLHETDLMQAYNRALVENRREEHNGVI